MSLNVWEQTSEIIKETGSIVLLTAENSAVEDITALVFMGGALQALGKKVKFFIPNWPLINPLPFENWIWEQIPKELIINELPTLDEYNQYGLYIPNLNQDFEDDIFLTFNILDNLGLEKLGQNEQYWKDHTVINISNNPAQENFGHLRLVDPTAPGLNTIVWKLLNTIFYNLAEGVKAETASLGYAGLLLETEHWSNNRITSSCLAAGGELLKLGADRNKIETLLRASAEPKTLRHWGKILSSLQPISDKVIFGLVPDAGPVRNSGKIQRLEKHRLERLAEDFLSNIENQGQAIRGAIIVWPEDQGLCCLWCRDHQRAEEIASELGVTNSNSLIFFQSPSLINLNPENQTLDMIKYLASLIEA
jgi:nanoRNase/pAp phosphatase (c-di-AMP/oligoRNAs hydrolase)